MSDAAKIISLGEHRAKREAKQAPDFNRDGIQYFVRVNVDADGMMTAHLLDLEETAKTKRLVAEDLRIIAGWLNTDAQKEAPNPNSNALIEIRVFESDKVVSSIRVGMLTSDPDHLRWIAERLEIAHEQVKTAIRNQEAAVLKE